MRRGRRGRRGKRGKDEEEADEGGEVERKGEEAWPPMPWADNGGHNGAGQRADGEGAGY